ncbi:MAG: hypothetical protein U0807_04165 [Candidatus Binatia bacterium]
MAVNSLVASETTGWPPNAHFIRTSILARRAFWPVDYHRAGGAVSGGFIDPGTPGRGLCEVCHRKTDSYSANGHGKAHVTVSLHRGQRPCEPPVTATFRRGGRFTAGPLQHSVALAHLAQHRHPDRRALERTPHRAWFVRPGCFGNSRRKSCARPARAARPLSSHRVVSIRVY